MSGQIREMIKAIGRPPKFSTPEEMSIAVVDYFENVAFVEGEDAVLFKPTITGLAYHLGMSTEALRNYEAKDEFLAIVKRSKQLVEMSLESRLDSNVVTGAIFSLKANFRWSDGKQEEASQDMATAMLELAKRLPQ